MAICKTNGKIFILCENGYVWIHSNMLGALTDPEPIKSGKKSRFVHDGKKQLGALINEELYNVSKLIEEAMAKTPVEIRKIAVYNHACGTVTGYSIIRVGEVLQLNIGRQYLFLTKEKVDSIVERLVKREGYEMMHDNDFHLLEKELFNRAK